MNENIRIGDHMRKIIKETRPVKFKQANSEFRTKNDEISMPVYIDYETGCIISCWKMPFIRRLRVLFTGRIWLNVLSEKHPLLYIESSVFENKRRD